MDELTITTHGDAASSPLGTALYGALEAALETPLQLPPVLAGMRGMSGRRYRRLINHLVSGLPRPRYLEVGSWAGSTACSAMWNNALTLTCIDDWSQFGGPRDEFMQNVAACRNADTELTLIEADFRTVDFSQLGIFDIYLFDGPHERVDQLDGVVAALPALAPAFILIVDDWNWAEVRHGTLEGLERSSLQPQFAIEIRTTQDGTHAEAQRRNSDWHNGYYLAAFDRPR